MKCRWSVKTLGSALVLAGLGCLMATRAVAQDGSAEDEQRAEAVRAKMYDSLAREAAALERQSSVLKTVVKLVQPTVVHIEAEKTDATSLRYGRKERIEEAGSGFLVKINHQEYVITNRHVIKAADKENIKIRLADGRQLNPTKSPLSDPDTDIAVMAVSSPSLIAARLGNSDAIEIGDFVLAVGSPFGLSHSITFGIVSATGRWDLKLGDGVKYQDFIQTDAAINPGNSGGPLINLRGEVIGMNTAIASSSGGNEGIGFSIPINVVMIVAKQLVERNSVVRGFLGVTLDKSFDSTKAISVGLKRPRGARVSDVNPGSPAAAAQLQKGDVIVQYGGAYVDNDSHLINLVHLTEVGREVPLSVFRDGQFIKVTVKAGSGVPANRVVAPKRPVEAANK
jgi:serine protease Do